MNKIYGFIFAGVLIMTVFGQARTSSDADLAVQYASSGWVEDAESRTWSYSSADAPTYIFSVNDDMTGIISTNMKLRFKQSAGTYKYAGVTAVSAYSGGVTLIAAYFGTDYDLDDEAITNVAYSAMRAPFGFPMSRDKWTVEVVDTSTRTQPTPTLGDWDISYKVFAGADLNLLTTNVYTTLSTANNTESNTQMTAAINIGISSASNLLIEDTLSASDFLSLTSKATYYLNAKTGTSGVPNIYFGGATIPTIIRAVWAGL